MSEHDSPCAGLQDVRERMAACERQIEGHREQADERHADLRERVGRVAEQVTTLDGKLDSQGEAIGSMRTEQGKISTRVGVLVTAITMLGGLLGYGGQAVTVRRAMQALEVEPVEAITPAPAADADTADADDDDGA